MRRREDVSVPGLELSDLVEALRSAPVTVGVLYGSLARGEGSARSDVDVAVAFEESLSDSERTAARLSLTRDIAVELGTDDVDVVPLSGATPELVSEIQRDGVLLVGTLDEFQTVASENGESRGRGDEDDVVASLDEVIADIDGVV